MDILDLDSSLKFVNHNGVCLNIEERMQLQLGLQQLLNGCENTDFEELLFWGKIIGLNKDYYIAMGITYSDKYEFPEKRFYWALSSDFAFSPFPDVNDQHRQMVDTVRGMFMGTP